MDDQTSKPDAGTRDARGAVRLTRGVTATWWYTLASVVFFQTIVVFLWTMLALGAGAGVAAVLAIGAGGVVWVVSTVLLLRDYRQRIADTASIRWRGVVGPLLLAVAYGALVALFTGSWLIAFLPLAQSLTLLGWPRGLRLRLVIGESIVLICTWIIDVRVTFGDGGRLERLPEPWTIGFLSIALPLMTVLSLWWWDVLIALDRARVSESRLAAAQERLRVATDVHDLQGHHLQVIALQLELAERLMSRDADAAAEQLRAARRSVDDARQGTRDLAMRFRSVPLGDELANARDLLRAADIATDATIAADIDLAPASVFGPVIRETTTNVLRHGGGRRARLSLDRRGDAWRYEISNDVDTDSVSVSVSMADGAGLDGIRRRAADAGGSMDVVKSGAGFAVIVTVPVAVGVSGEAS